MAFVDLGISVRKRERRNASTHTTTCALPDALKAAAAALAKRPPAERYAKLAEMGVAYEPCSLEMKYRTKENRVPGCTSVVYIHAVVRGGAFSLPFDSSSFRVEGERDELWIGGGEKKCGFSYL